MERLDYKWMNRLSVIDFAFQPIVNIHTGACYGYEALLRNYEKAGFDSIGSLFDDAYESGVLHKVDMALRKKAFSKFGSIPWSDTAKLFYNLDNRLFHSPDYSSGYTDSFLKTLLLANENIIFEISEKHELEGNNGTINTLKAYRRQGFKIAVDDCGTGFSGLQLLYYTEPDCIKIDRFFIQDIESDAKKRLFVSSIVEIAHLMGNIVVAEGIETKKEYYSCRNIGCDLIQGYFIQRPQTDIALLQPTYEAIEVLGKSDLRNRSNIDRTLIKTEMEYIEPVDVESDVMAVFESFRLSEKSQFFPVINRNREVVGIIRESSFKDFAYSRFGRQLLENPRYGGSIHNYISRFPVADIESPVEKLLQIVAQNDSYEGVLILEGLKYVGFLSAMSLLKIVNEKNLNIAREQNPLTKLPGNTLIHEYISSAISERENSSFFIYFDFDNFKAYNDKFGFRNGDRLILRFAELLRIKSNAAHIFVGHIGGDDFFLGARKVSLEWVVELAKELTEQFRVDAESFYDAESRENGYVITEDRNGEKQRFPLITVSAAILELPASLLPVTNAEDIGNAIAALKKRAKNAPDNICIENIQNIGVDAIAS